MTETQGEIIITLESEERHYSYDQLGLTFDSASSEVISSLSSMLEEDLGFNLNEEYEDGNWSVKKVDSSGNTYIFPKSTAG